MKSIKFFFVLLLFISSSCSAQINGTYDILSKKEKIWIVAHRALTGENIYPENSLATIESCIRNKIDVVEIDVRETKDGKLIVIHDKTVDRTTTGKGNVKDYTLEEIKRLRLVHDGVVSNQQVPTLEEVLQMVKNKIMVDLDIKLDTITSYLKVADLISKHQIQDQMIVFLYDKEEIEPAHRMFKKVNIMPRARSLVDVESIREKYPFISIIHIDEKSYDNDMMKRLVTGGIRIWMNSLGEYDKEVLAGKNGFDNFFSKYPNVNVVQTDCAIQLLKYLKK